MTRSGPYAPRFRSRTRSCGCERPILSSTCMCGSASIRARRLSPWMRSARLGEEAENADELVAAAIGQLDDGADLVKLYLDGPEKGVCPWTANELRRVVDAVHARGARVTAHSGEYGGARAGAEAGVDALEHGFELDDETARLMAANGVRLISTLCVLASWRTFGATT